MGAGQGRFLDYARTGHGGNVELRRRGRRRDQVSVPEVVNSGINIEQVEEAWKRKLLTREFGLNDPRPDTPLPDGLGGSAHLQSSIVEPQP